ncbi:McrC family protein [Fimbriiglobus ruber]|uniref:McrBC 5-methylcytosine restriction system component-like protein n=1 Tax=Fimbriiglobus ruber TaxID=1908690 RepID=A0A225CZW0_9BACT|nr:hypothetical protein [Fimbriiglobus ruber]OWK34792.1 McrBC 5-methylcytosine restriction system component-like protein [Fimbriiglobus ruber]
MTRPHRIIVVTERRPVIRRLPWADIDDLLRSFRPLVDIVPTFTRGEYRLTPRGHVGVFHTTNLTWHVRPKIGWTGFRFLLGEDIPARAGGPTQREADWPAELATLVAHRLAVLMYERATAGLLRGYAERETVSDTVRGRIDLGRQTREAGRIVHRFHLIEDEFTTDIAWNQIPVTVAHDLLQRIGLAPDVRLLLTRAVDLYPGVTRLSRLTPESFGRLVYDPRTTAYRPLIELCRLVDTSPGPASASDNEVAHKTSLLLNLEQLFQQHVTRILSQSTRLPAGWTVNPTPPVVLRSSSGTGDLELLPDLLVADAAGGTRGVWDVKWKRLAETGPEPADAHQALGYAAATGSRVAGLIYPGRRFAVRSYSADGGVRLFVVTHRVAGTAVRLDQGIDRLVRLVFTTGNGPAAL